MIMSRIARTFVTRHCADLAAARHYARANFLGMRIASVVTDSVASLASQDKVVGARLCQMDPGGPWVLAVNGLHYDYSECSDREGSLTLYDKDMPETAITYVGRNSVSLIDLIASASQQVPFYLCHGVMVQSISRDIVEHPYRRTPCTTLQFMLKF